jgi:hypothetical protein
MKPRVRIFVGLIAAAVFMLNRDGRAEEAKLPFIANQMGYTAEHTDRCGMSSEPLEEAITAWIAKHLTLRDGLLFSMEVQAGRQQRAAQPPGNLGCAINGAAMLAYIDLFHTATGPADLERRFNALLRASRH